MASCLCIATDARFVEHSEQHSIGSDLRTWFPESGRLSLYPWLLPVLERTLVRCEMQDTLVAKYAADWREHLEWDDEKQHTVELYMIWNEKSSFLKYLDPPHRQSRCLQFGIKGLEGW
eukprot:1800121-Rhodomonas_salina.3